VNGEFSGHRVNRGETELMFVRLFLYSCCNERTPKIPAATTLVGIHS
jgi:hypothetical protein